MKYFYDTEFLEGTQKSFFGQSKPTIDLISIGIVCEDGREYYAISKDFNLKEAWNRYDKVVNRHFPLGPEYNKVYWIRENVLRPIYSELLLWEHADKLYVKIGSSEYQRLKEMRDKGEITIKYPHFDKCYKDFNRLLKKYGKTNKQIAQEIKNFCYSDKQTRDKGGQLVSGTFIPNEYPEIKLYSYYSAYDHVALCWLFGKMIDLPKGFPMYTIDLKQDLDNKERSLRNDNGVLEIVSEPIFEDGLKLVSIYGSIKEMFSYPKQTNEHNALSDAIFVKNLYQFLNTFKFIQTL